MKSKSEKRPEKGRALFYSRDSGGKHDQTPSQYVEWACRKATEVGLEFNGTPEAIREMILQGEPVSGDIYFDDNVQGNRMSRPALDALRETIVRDRSVSHVLIPKRNRLARPDNASDGMALEVALRAEGGALVFFDKTLAPIHPGRRQDFVEVLTSMIDYHQSGEFRTGLAEKMVYAQLQLARQRFSTGGRAPFGFRRALVSGTGN